MAGPYSDPACMNLRVHIPPAAENNSPGYPLWPWVTEQLVMTHGAISYFSTRTVRDFPSNQELKSLLKPSAYLCPVPSSTRPEAQHYPYAGSPWADIQLADKAKYRAVCQASDPVLGFGDFY